MFFDLKTIAEQDSFFSLEKIFSTIEAFTGMEVSMHSTELPGSGFNRSMDNVSYQYRKHMSDFCCTVKENKTVQDCGGYDATRMVKKAIAVGEPFVNICHAGIAEVIFPVCGARNKPVVTVHIGQAITEEIAKEGFAYVRNRVKDLGVDEDRLEAAFAKLPHMKSVDLLNIGKVADLAVKGFIAHVGAELFEYEIRLIRYPAIRKAIDIIQAANNFKDIDQTAVADKVFLNPSYFCRLFKEALGCTFSDYLCKKKIEKAVSLLRSTDLSIMEIALQCGYSTQSYFTSMFKHHTGVTPTQYRNSH